MNTDHITEQPLSSEGGAVAERRGNSRFPLHEELKYKVLHAKGEPIVGIGKTLNIGSRGMLFTTEGLLPVGRMVELSVNWPARLDGTCALKFVAVGRVMRSDSGKAAVKIDRYQFKTRGASLQPLQTMTA